MPDPSTPTDQKETPPQIPAYQYRLKFEPVGEFSESQLFIASSVKGKIWISDQTYVVMKSLLGSEVDEINSAVKATPDMTIGHFNTELTYRNLAHAMVELAGKPFDGTLDEKLKKIRGLAGPVLGRLSLAYLEFGHHVDDLFVGKAGLETAKKS